MPPAAYQGRSELSIELDNVGGPQQPCQPGEVITGRITRSLPGVSPRTTISLRLLGRAKTKITVTTSNGQSTSKSHYRNRFNFFETTQTRQLIHDGPMHITPGGGEPFSWPFDLEVPLHPSLQAIRSGGGTPDTCFLSLEPRDVASTPLPASFYASGRHRNTRFEAYVEYHLEADLVDSGHHGKAITAVMPIQMRAHPSMPCLLADFDIQRRALQGQISTYRLVPGMENAELSLKQKTKQFMGSSKVPMFGFSIQVDCPAIIQLGNPAPIPFSMQVVPDRRRTSEVLHDVTQTVSLHSLELVLKAHTATLAPATFCTKHADGTLKHNMSLPVSALGKSINPPMAKDSSAGVAQGGESSSATAQRTSHGLVLPSRWELDKETALDIGAALDFRLFSTHATALGQVINRTSPAQGLIYPSFTTYGIRHSAMLKWKAEIEIAGQTEKFESQQAVTIIGPSDSAPRPAAPAQPTQKSDQLPSYEDRETFSSGGPGVAGNLGEELPAYTK